MVVAEISWGALSVAVPESVSLPEQTTFTADEEIGGGGPAPYPISLPNLIPTPRIFFFFFAVENTPQLQNAAQ